MNEELMELFKSKAKLLKCDFVTVMGEYILGTDEHSAHLSLISHTEPRFWDLENRIFEAKDFILSSKLIDFAYLFKTLNWILSHPVVVHKSDLQEDEKFKEIMAKKSSEGMSMINIDGYLLSVNKSLVPLNKSDKLDLNIRDFGNSFSGEFIITRGKNIIKKNYLYIKPEIRREYSQMIQ